MTGIVGSSLGIQDGMLSYSSRLLKPTLPQTLCSLGWPCIPDSYVYITRDYRLVQPHPGDFLPFGVVNSYLQCGSLRVRGVTTSTLNGMIIYYHWAFNTGREL